MLYENGLNFFVIKLLYSDEKEDRCSILTKGVLCESNI